MLTLYICKKMRNGLTETFSHMMAKDLTRQALIDYAVKRFQAGNRPATIHKIMVYFHEAVFVAVMEEKIPARLEWKLKGLGKELSDLIGSIKNERKYVFTPAQIQAVFNSTSNLKHRAIFEILFHTGMRKGELAKMVWGDIQNGFAVLRAEITKTHQRRVVPLNRYSLAAFAELRKLNPLATDAERILDYSLDRRNLSVVVFSLMHASPLWLTHVGTLFSVGIVPILGVISVSCQHCPSNEKVLFRCQPF